MYAKKCSCGEFQFTLQSKPNKEQSAICPTCGTEVSLADSKPLPETKPAADAAPKEGI